MSEVPVQTYLSLVAETGSRFAGSIYGKPESGHKEGEPDVVGIFSVNRDENLTVVANREHIEDKEGFAKMLLIIPKNFNYI